MLDEGGTETESAIAISENRTAGGEKLYLLFFIYFLFYIHPLTLCIFSQYFRKDGCFVLL